MQKFRTLLSLFFQLVYLHPKIMLACYWSGDSVRSQDCQVLQNPIFFSVQNRSRSYLQAVVEGLEGRQISQVFTVFAINPVREI